MRPVFDEIRSVDTDGAVWFLFHPNDLRHRNGDPADWCVYDFAIQREFSDGNLIGIRTDADTDCTIRLTNGPLTKREQDYAVHSMAFRMVVRHGKLLIGGDIICLVSMAIQYLRRRKRIG